MPSLYKPVLLIIVGAFLVAFAIGNTFFNLSDVMAETFQLARIQSTGNQGVSDVSLDPASEPVPAARVYLTGSETTPPLVAMDPSPVQPTEIIQSAGIEQPAVIKPVIAGFIPDRIEIPAIKLDAPVIQSQQKSVELKKQWFDQWLAPDEFAAGWQTDSAPLGLPGNTVLSGHHNEYGKVFGHLVELKVGDTITLFSGNTSFEYQIAEINILKEKNVSLDIRQQNAKWIATSADERITLVTCWPKRNNSHRLIVVAYPIKPDLNEQWQKFN